MAVGLCPLLNYKSILYIFGKYYLSPEGGKPFLKRFLKV